MANAYLYGDMDFEVIMEQPTNSSGKEAMPNYLYLLQKSMYGLKQAGRIWGSMVAKKFLGWGPT